MIRKHIWKSALSLCTAFLLVFSQPLSAVASENSAVAAEETESTDDVTEEERLEPDAYFETIQSNEVEGWPQGPAVWAESAVVMDIDSGAFLYSKNTDVAKYPASITKIMTTLLALENCSLNECVTFSKNAIYGIERNSSHIGIRPGEILSMEECLYGMMLASANEVCLAVAEHVAGSVDAFVEMMNQKAIELGCTNTHFTNPNGLPDEQHYTTAHDMALIAQAAYQNSTFRTICQTEVSHIPTTNMCGEERWFQNHHKMLLDGEFHYDGCTGGKTGYTQAALNTLVTYAERDGRRLLCVTFRTNGRQVYTDTAALLDYGFNNFQNITLYSRSSNSAVAMLYPSIYFGQAMTVDKMRSNCIVTVPASVTQDQLQFVSSMTNGVITHDYQYHGYSVGAETVSANNFISLMYAGAGMELPDANFNGPIINAASIEAITTTVTPSESIQESEVSAEPLSPDETITIEATLTTEDTDTTLLSTFTNIKDSIITTADSIFQTIAHYDYAALFQQMPAYIYGLIILLAVFLFMEIYFIFLYFKRRKKRRKTREQRKRDRESQK